MAAEVLRPVRVLKTFEEKLPTRHQMEWLSGPATRALAEFGVAFELKFTHPGNTFWQQKWGVNGTQTLGGAVASVLKGGGHNATDNGGTCSWHSSQSPAVTAHARANIKRLFNTEPFAVLMLRRGDRTRMYPKCSKAENVARVFLRHVREGKPPLPRAVFLATDEHDPAYLRALRIALAVILTWCSTWA